MGDLDLAVGPCTDCKSTQSIHEFSFENTRSYYIPIFLEGHKFRALLDPGATHSTVSLSLCRQMGWKIASRSGHVHTAHKSTLIPRIGVTFNKLKVICNDKAIDHQFEVFDLHGKADIAIGNDLKHHFGIYIGNLPYCWHRPGIPRDPPTMPDEYIPNDSPVGTKEQHQSFMDAIAPYLDENAAIPKNAHCTMPEAVVRLPTPPGKVAYRAPYRIAEALKPVLQKQIDEWLQAGVIAVSPTYTPFNSGLTCVPKRDPVTKEPIAYRWCVDSRPLNSMLDDYNYPIPDIPSIFASLAGNKVYSVCDVSAAFHTMPVAPEDQHKLGMIVNKTCYIWKRASFGLKFLSSQWCSLMTKLTHDLPYLHTYLDDIIVASPDLETHKQHVSELIKRLTSVNLTLNRKKCHFAQKCVYLLGHRISPLGIALDPRKVSNVLDWPRPQTGRDVQSFLGLCNYFRTFLPRAAELMRPLDHLRNACSLDGLWTIKHTEAFERLKEALTRAPVLSNVDMNHDIHLATDASSTSIGGMLFQVIDNQYRYIGFVARALTSSEKNYGTTKRELLAIVYCLQKWRHWLWGLRKPFTVYTDHRALTFLHTQPVASPMIVNWYDIIGDYSFKVAHIPGIQNLLPDYLSRLFSNPLDERSDAGTSLEQVDTPTSTDTQSPALRMSQVTQTSDMITPPEDARAGLLQEAHLLGHFGADAIVNALHDDGLHWTNVRKDALNTVAKCPDCQRFNIGKHGYHPLQHVKADRPGDQWAIDLGDFNVTSDSGNNFLLVMLDIFTRFVVLRAIPDKSASTIARTLVDVFSLLGYPMVLTHDWGTEFHNSLCKLLAKTSGYELRLSSKYHPRGNGAVENAVGIAKRTIIKRLQGKNSEWDLYVSSAQLAMNCRHTKLHSSRPFSVMLGRKPNGFQDYTGVQLGTASSSSKDTKALMQHIVDWENIVLPAISARMDAVRTLEKSKFDSQNRIIDGFPIGSKVMIKNIARAAKTDPLYVGPYTVYGITKGGSYVLSDTTGELLSRNVPPSHMKTVSADTTVQSEDTYEILAVVDHKLDRNSQYLYRVRWKGYDDPEEDTWEPTDNFNSLDLIQQYWSRRATAPDPSNKRRRADGTSTTSRANSFSTTSPSHSRIETRSSKRRRVATTNTASSTKSKRA